MVPLKYNYTLCEYTTQPEENFTEEVTQPKEERQGIPEVVVTEEQDPKFMRNRPDVIFSKFEADLRSAQEGLLL